MDSRYIQNTRRYSENDYPSRGRYKNTGIAISMVSTSGERRAQLHTLGLEEYPQTHGSYKALVFHPKWTVRRKEILLRDHHSCVNCGASEELQVHHRQYHFVLSTKQFKAPWDYPNHLLITLCDKCHSKGHSKFKVPIIKL